MKWHINQDDKTTTAQKATSEVLTAWTRGARGSQHPGRSAALSLRARDMAEKASHLTISTRSLHTPGNWSPCFQRAASRSAKAHRQETMWPQRELSQGQSEKAYFGPGLALVALIATVRGPAVTSNAKL